jgi:glycine reductase
MERMIVMELQGKKVYIIGERDGVPAESIAECIKAAGGEVAYMATECFV